MLRCLRTCDRIITYIHSLMQRIWGNCNPSSFEQRPHNVRLYAAGTSISVKTEKPFKG